MVYVPNNTNKYEWNRNMLGNYGVYLHESAALVSPDSHLCQKKVIKVRSKVWPLRDTH